MKEHEFKPGWLQNRVALSKDALARIPAAYGGTATLYPAERAIEIVREALSDLAAEPYGDLACDADRAAVIAVAALRKAGMLPLLTEGSG